MSERFPVDDSGIVALTRTEHNVRPLAPNTYALIKSYRSLGHSFEEAVSELVDNSIDAGAERIQVIADWNGSLPHIAIIDDGHGMTEDELLVAMSPGVIDPDARRREGALGLFGVGLKAASLSQANSFTVISKRREADIPVYLRWIVSDETCATGVTDVRLTTDISGYARGIGTTHLSRQSSGTVVVWERLHNQFSERRWFRALSQLSEFLATVFHRFLSTDVQGRHLTLSLNSENLFKSAMTVHRALEGHDVLPLGVRGQSAVIVKPFVIPKRLRPQLKPGLYFYRNSRLIQWGGWAGVSLHIHQKSLLSRVGVSIEVPDRAVREWSIDISKSKATVPSAVAAQLASAIEEWYVQQLPRKGQEAEQATLSEASGGHSFIVRDNPEIGPLLALSGDDSFTAWLTRAVAEGVGDEGAPLLLGVIYALIASQIELLPDGYNAQSTVSRLAVKRALEQLIPPDAPEYEQAAIQDLVVRLCEGDEAYRRR